MHVDLAAQGIEAHRECNDQTNNDLLPERGHVQDVEAVTNHSQQNTPEIPPFLGVALVRLGKEFFAQNTPDSPCVHVALQDGGIADE